MVVLYQFEISPYCDKIRRILHTKRQPYEVREVPPSAVFTTVRRVNPIGKLPTIEHEGRTIADSTEIAHYLEETFPDPPLVPKDPRERALCHMLEDWADESLYFYEMYLRFTLPHNARRWIPELMASDNALMKRLAPYVLPAQLRSTLKSQGTGRKPKELVVREVARHVASVGDRVGESGWLVGDALSLADVSVFSQLFCIRGADEGARLVEADGRVSDWMERVDRATQPSS